ncbi:HAUS augmin-like complex subunit 1 isoform X2 [Acipenser ruthenus]|uniref:HAUS augmin-like complex subunit 1 isoform X2 n=1 Tax=Acipenser ruthenus TaxID=7906 RepID=UPI002741608F|nr:HAUS augmin-like complex subunit 1 isoform X2 [Acipenser ruthenus]
MCEKNIKVTQWLSNIFGDQPIPHYEVNTRTTEILYQLAECSEARCRDVVLLTEDLEQKAAEYGTEGSYLQELLLEGVGLSTSSLSKTASSYLNALEGSAMALNTKDTSLASYVAAMNDLTADILATEKKNQEMDHELTILRKKLTSALVLRKSLQEDLSKTEENQAVEKARAENRLQNMDFFKAKSEDLKFRIKAAEGSKKHRGCTVGGHKFHVSGTYESIFLIPVTGESAVCKQDGALLISPGPTGSFRETGQAETRDHTYEKEAGVLPRLNSKSVSCTS